MSFCLSTVYALNLSRLKVTTNIIILSVLVCFVLNNLLFTYGTEKQERTVLVCITNEEMEDGCCAEEEDMEILCCSEDGCCARIPVQSSHLNFSVIIGADEKNEAMVPADHFNTFQLSHLRTATELSEGHLSSLIKPPAVS